jgi:hypothetical protein
MRSPASLALAALKTIPMRPDRSRFAMLRLRHRTVRRAVAPAIVVVVLGLASTATFGATGISGPTSQAPVLDDQPGLAAVVQAEMAILPKNAIQVDCAPGRRTLPPQTRLSRPLGFHDSHPGFYTISDGSCWLDPSATPRPLPSSLDALQP